MLPEQFKHAIRWVLKEIKMDELVTSDGYYVKFKITPSNSDNGIPSPKDQRRVIKFLEKMGGLTIHSTSIQNSMLSISLQIQGMEPEYDNYLLDILQPKFDELYNEYVGTNGIDEKSEGWRKLLIEEKERIEQISTAEQFELAILKWSHIKYIIDAIYNLISPFDSEKPISGVSSLMSEEQQKIWNQNIGQKIHLDPSLLSAGQQHFFESTLRHLLENGIVSYANYEYMVSTSKPIREFYNGNILIKDRRMFENFHTALNIFFDSICKIGRKKFHPQSKSQEQTTEDIETTNRAAINDTFKQFQISVKDREIWVNDCLLSRPHAVGGNLEFFEFIRAQPSNTKIECCTVKNDSYRLNLEKAINGRRFVKILNELGFKREIKKVFFYKVGQDSLFYRGDTVSNEVMEKENIDIGLVQKELEAVHSKNCPV